MLIKETSPIWGLMLLYWLLPDIINPLATLVLMILLSVAGVLLAMLVVHNIHLWLTTRKSQR